VTGFKKIAKTSRDFFPANKLPQVRKWSGKKFFKV